MLHTKKRGKCSFFAHQNELSFPDNVHQLTSFSFSRPSYLSWRFLYSNCHFSAFMASAECLVWSSWACKSESIGTACVGKCSLYKLNGFPNTCTSQTVFSITWTSTQEQVSLSLPVSCRCPADCGQRWPCGAPPPARRCAACTRCCAPPGGAPVCAGLPDPPASSCTSPPVLQAGSPCQTSAWGGGEDSVGGVEYQHRNMTFTQYIHVDVCLTAENQQLWRKQCQCMKFILSTQMSERGAEWTSVFGQCGSCFCEWKLIIDELLLKGKRLVIFYSFERVKCLKTSRLTMFLNTS